MINGHPREYELFGRGFLEVYLANGLGSLPKREVDLLVLRLLVESEGNQPAHVALAEADAFVLGKRLGIKAARVRSMLDELRYRSRPDDEFVREQLKASLTRGERQIDGTQVRIQLDDAFLRDYVKRAVRDDFGIVDSSFDRSIITLSAPKFLGLVLNVLGPDVQATFQRELAEARTSNAPVSAEGLSKIFLRNAAESAGKEAGKQMIQLGVDLLKAGAEQVGGLIQAGLEGLGSFLG